MTTTQVRGSTQIMPGTITNTEISASAAIANSKLAGAPTASNTANTIALRDASGRAQFADPSSAQDAATKAYVDGLINGVDVKSSVRVATTANITLSATQTIDGVALSVGDRVLVKDQSTGSQNGIYAVASGAWSRTTDADANAEVTAGMYVFVTEGTSNADTGWLLTTNDTITIGTTALTFTQFTGAGQIVAGSGLTKTGNTLDIGAGNGITVNADTIETIYGASGDMVASAVGDSVSAGSANKAARADHKHAREAFGTPSTTHGIGQANAAGSATTVARSDHAHSLAAAGAPAASAVGDTVVTGTATTFAASDHKHARETFAAPITSNWGDATTQGSATTVARSDHKHGRETITSGSFTGDGSTVAFNLGGMGDMKLKPDIFLQVFLNGLLQRTGASYDFTYYKALGPTEYTSITFTSPPATGDWIMVYYQYQNNA